MPRTQRKQTRNASRQQTKPQAQQQRARQQNAPLASGSSSVNAGRGRGGGRGRGRDEEGEEEQQEEEERGQKRARVREEAAAREDEVVDTDAVDSPQEEQNEDADSNSDSDASSAGTRSPPAAPGEPQSISDINNPAFADGWWEATNSRRHQKEVSQPRRHRFWTGRDWYTCPCHAPICRCGMASSDEEQIEGPDEDWWSEEDPFAEIDPDETEEERQEREDEEEHRDAAERYRAATRTNSGTAAQPVPRQHLDGVSSSWFVSRTQGRTQHGPVTYYSGDEDEESGEELIEETISFPFDHSDDEEDEEDPYEEDEEAYDRWVAEQRQARTSAAARTGIAPAPQRATPPQQQGNRIGRGSSSSTARGRQPPRRR